MPIQGLIGLGGGVAGISQLEAGPQPFEARVLIVGGGGGSGGWIGGGGGAGGFRIWGERGQPTIELITYDVYQVTVGAGGPYGPVTHSGVGSAGSDSEFNGLFAAGGGGGGGWAAGNGTLGGSGGGNSGPGNRPNTTPPQGNDGGPGTTDAGGGGGGFSENGYQGANYTGTSRGGDGAGSLISGFDMAYSGGGGGGLGSTIAGVQGGGPSIGGGGRAGNYGTSGQAGTYGTGGGGGAPGNAGASGGSGGSGVVVVRHPSKFSPTLVSGSLSFVVNNLGSEAATVFSGGTGTITWS